MSEYRSSTLNTSAVIRYVLRNKPEYLPRLLEGMDQVLGTTADQAEEALGGGQRWVPLAAFQILLKRAEEDIFKDSQVTYRMGFEALAFHRWDFTARVALHLFAHPRALFRMGGWLATRHTEQIKVFKATRFTSTGCRIKVLWEQDAPLEAASCRFMQGAISAMPLTWGQPPFEIREITCQFQNAPQCLFEVSWAPMGLREWLTAALWGTRTRSKEALLRAIEDSTLNLAMLGSRLHAAQSSYHAIVQSAPDAICEIIPSGVLTPLNRRCIELFGSDMDQQWRMLGDVVHPDDLPQLLSLIATKPDDPKMIQSHRFRILQPDGKPSLVDGRFTTIEDPGRHRVVLAVLRDISAQDALAQALAQEHMRFHSLAEHSPLGLAFIGADGAYQYTNPRFEELFGYTGEKLGNGARWFELAYPEPEQRKRIIAQWKIDKLNENGPESRNRSYTVTCRDGSHKDILFRPVTLPSGEQLVTYEDITERNRMETEQQESARLAGVVETAGAAAHELNQPLTALMASAELIKRYDDIDQIKRLAVTVDQEATRLGEMVGRLGKVVRYETKAYLQNDRIIDLQKAASDPGEPDPEM